MTVLAAAAAHGPHIDFAGLSPLIALAAGAIVVLLVGLLPGRWARATAVPALSLGALAVTLGLTVWQYGSHKAIVAGVLRVDDLALTLDLIFVVAGMATVLLAWRGRAVASAGHGEFCALLLSTILGMAVLVGAQNMLVLFLGYELLSISLYVMCATEVRRAASLESGLKYLIVGSVGSATLVYGLALIYGATGATDFGAIAHVLGSSSVVNDVLLLTGIALVVVGLGFKSSVAPFHQWTPDVYEGAPTPVTAFMAVATKAAAFGVFLRFFDQALIAAQHDWAPILAALATITIVVGNVGALGQSSLKRMLAYSSVAQAGYMLAGVVVASRLGIKATVFYLGVYLFMNLAAFAVVVARERETPWGDDMRSITGLGAARPLLAWPMTIAMLSLAGIPATAGFVGKFYLIESTVDGGYTWLGVIIMVGSMISLGYYLRVIAAMWMRPAPAAAEWAAAAGRRGGDAVGARPVMAGGSPELGELGEPDGADGAGVRPQVEVVFVALLFAAASIFFGIVASPLLHLAVHAGGALTNLF